MSEISDTSAQVLHENGQEALLGAATIDMNAHEKWMLEQLLLAYVADSVPAQTWRDLAAGVRAVRRDRARRPGSTPPLYT